MPRPQLKPSFLNYVTNFTKKGTVIFYYDFGKQEDLGKILEKIKKDFKKKYKVLKMVDNNEYKRRQAAPALRVSTKAFGYGRRYPVVQGWRK